MLFTIIGFLGCILILSYYLCATSEPLPVERTPLMTQEKIPEEVQTTDNEELLNKIRRRLKPKDVSSSKEGD